MGKSIGIDQSHAIMAVLGTNVDWSVLDGDFLQEKIVRNPTEAGRQFTDFLKNGGKVIVGEPRIILIDRSQPFDPIKFLGKGWSFEEQDERSLALTELDLTKVRLEIMLMEGEAYINGEEKLRQLKKADYIRLDAKVFQTLWENQMLIPERWKEKTNGDTTYIYFDGTVLRSPDGDRYVLCLDWSDGQWDWYYDWLGSGWDVLRPSAVLASI